MGTAKGATRRARLVAAARAHAQALPRSPLAWILAAQVVLHVVGIGWGLPASDGWDNDGVAPRDFLAGLAETFTPGHHTTYPPVHLAILAVVTAPVTLAALARAPSLARADVVAQMLHVPTMTALAYGARAVTVAMALGVAWAVARMVEEVRGARAGACAAAFVGVNVPFTYYAHTSNLDVPYLFWGCLALLALVRAIHRREPERLRAWALFAALAVGTKDQAYALFLLAVPGAVALWIALDPWAREHARAVVRQAASAGAMAVVAVLLVDGALVNPSGFAARLRFLRGPASQAYASYSDDWTGRFYVVADLGAKLVTYYPLALVVLAGLGLVLLVRCARVERAPARLVAGLVPLLAALSFTVAFNCVARRTDHRFGLPQAVLAATYGGVAVDALVFRARTGPAARWLLRLAVAAAFAVALFGAADVDANLVLDPRYEAEDWLRAHVRPGDAIETYGLDVYMPRFPEGAHVVRVGPSPDDHRSPMAGVEELLADYDGAAARGARFIVVSEGWAWRYLIDPADFPTEGRRLPPVQVANGSDARATAYFRALTESRYAPYTVEHVARWGSTLWPAIELHASTSREIWIYERRN